MGIIWVEVCLISAHGIHHSSSLWRRQWFAVGWIDYDSKYCTKVDDSGNENPVWRTKFAIPVDDSAPNFQDLALNVEVYSMDPIFLIEKLHGSATVVLREFLVKQGKNSEVSRPTRPEEVKSYKLQKKKSSKPRGFIDISFRVFEEKNEPNSLTGGKGGIVVLDRGSNTQLTVEGGLEQTYPKQQPQVSTYQSETHLQTNIPDSHSVPFPTTPYPDRADPYVGEPGYHEAAGPSYRLPRTRTPPPPPPPSNVGYIPTFLPRNDDLPLSFTDMPPLGAAHHQREPPGFTMGLGAGALAAGSVIFGDDFMSGFDVPPGLGDASVTEEIDPTF